MSVATAPTNIDCTGNVFACGQLQVALRELASQTDRKAANKRTTVQLDRVW